MTTLKFITILDDIRAERVRIVNGWKGVVPDWPSKTGPHWGLQWNILKPSQVQKWAWESSVYSNDNWAMEFMAHVAEAMACEDEARLRGKLVKLCAHAVLWMESLEARKAKNG